MDTSASACSAWACMLEVCWSFRLFFRYLYKVYVFWGKKNIFKLFSWWQAFDRSFHPLPLYDYSFRYALESLVNKTFCLQILKYLKGRVQKFTAVQFWMFQFIYYEWTSVSQNRCFDMVKYVHIPSPCGIFQMENHIFLLLLEWLQDLVGRQKLLIAQKYYVSQEWRAG